MHLESTFNFHHSRIAYFYISHYFSLVLRNIVITFELHVDLNFEFKLELFLRVGP